MDFICDDVNCDEVHWVKHQLSLTQVEQIIKNWT